MRLHIKASSIALHPPQVHEDTFISCAGLFGAPVKDTLSLEVDMEVHSTNHTRNAQLLSMSLFPNTPAASMKQHIPVEGYILHPHPNMTAENKPQLLAPLHKSFQTELKHMLLEQPCHLHLLPQRLDLQDTPLKPR